VSSSIQPADNRNQVGWSPVPTLLILALAMFLCTAGIVAGPALGYRGAVAQCSAFDDAEYNLMLLHEQAEDLRTRIDAGQLEELTAALRTFMPAPPDRVALYGDVRSAADLSGVTLENIVFAKVDTPLGPGSQGQWVRLVTLNVAGEAQPVAVERLLQLLRHAGHPLLVTGFSLHRSQLGDSSFQFRLQLGFPFYGPAPDVPQDGLDMTRTPQL